MKAISAAAGTRAAAEVEATLAYFIEQIVAAREQMKADDAAIARIKTEAAALKAESITLKMESAALQTETRAIIAGLRSAA